MKAQRLWSKKITWVLAAYAKSPEYYLFGLTGDIDNLGIFVAQNGRPLAENLVDIYNHLVGAFLYDFVNKNKKRIVKFSLIPSGEEVFAIGLAKDSDVAENFFIKIKGEINSYIASNSPIYDKDITISFGCRILNPVVNISEIGKFIQLVKKKNNKKASASYLQIMYNVRASLAYELDCEKFKDLDALENQTAILYRNLVNLKLLEYKKRTRKLIRRVYSTFAKEPKVLTEFKQHQINQEYGVKEDWELLIEAFKE
jgi:hypothetical protein